MTALLTTFKGPIGVTLSCKIIPYVTLMFSGLLLKRSG